MEIKYLLKGMIIGFSIAAPVGPIGLLCIKRSLTHGFFPGLVTGLGAATADAFYGVAAGFSLVFITEFFLNMKIELHIAGGLFLCFLGWQSLRKKAAESQDFDSRFSGYASAYVSTLLLTLTNPMTIMAFMGIFAGCGIGAANDGYAASSTLVAGVFSGSALWWLSLAWATVMADKRLNHGFIEKINIATGIVLFFFGVWAVGSVLVPTN